ncbi:hypothetical protein [Alkalibacter mobilis]|uniref:hypothetical protein n=1 Tax=Alkalibacter mobilis TaxID=2787712 RepID=UPI0018A0F479|nr:hypothetical protein [Alkalibacter mobilis]MBF7096285.1 hypothetical protein [Alkalibacter mobilis]
MIVRKALLFGLIAQIIILIVAFVMQNWHFIVSGNFIVIGIGIVAGKASQNSSGWEFIGTDKKEKDEIYTYRSKMIWKWFLFILPGIFVVLVYYFKVGTL